MDDTGEIAKILKNKNNKILDFEILSILISENTFFDGLNMDMLVQDLNEFFNR